MKRHFFESLNNIINLNPKTRRFILIFIDLSIIILSLNIVIYKINIDTIYTLKKEFFYYVICSLFGLFTYILTGQYKGITRFQGSNFYYKLILRNLFLSLFSLITYSLIFSENWNFSNFLELLISLSSISLLMRFLLKDILNKLYTFSSKKIKYVAIYGAGNAGAQLESSMRFSKEYQVICFIDDNKNLNNRYLNNKPIFLPNKLSEIKQRIDQVLLAIPSLDISSRKKIINFLSKQKINTYIVPTIEELSSERITINNIRPIKIEDILGRNSVIPDKKLLLGEISLKVICVIGGAGSIGSQLCKEIIQLKPKKIICIDQSEFAIYNLESTLKSKFSGLIEIEYILLNAQNTENLERIFLLNNVDIVFHAAAYKHVPLVEKNPLSGIFNNVWTTKSVCDASLKANVSKVMLISTDKAVRPTNVMGASKRLSELVVQAYADNTRLFKSKNIQDKTTIFSMVRFGNVLDSSGSVVPLFKKQIAKGGPLTVTHAKVTRYFMTIPEAAQLVIQSISLARGGDVFLLDMGEPIKIYDLAKQMIELSGLSIKNNYNPNGDIEIKITGLRPGEKLFEELLIDAKSEKTNHDLIYRAVENFIPYNELNNHLLKLRKFIEDNNKNLALNQLSKLVPEWKRFY